jgi:uncharacterized SAM-binding protein YcdF (DUF218 family)
LPKNRLIASIFFIALAFGVGVLVHHHWRLVTSEPLTSWTQDPSADCAVVLTGGVGRIREGLSLLSRRIVKKVIISGVYPEVQFNELYAATPLMGEINEADVILERRSQTTFGNAQQSVPIVETLRCRDVLLVTSQTHMNRAYQTFRAALPREIRIEKHTLPSPRNETSTWDLGLEIAKSIFYSIWAY